MKRPNFGNLPLFRWDRNASGSSATGGGRQRVWFTNLDQTNLFRWGAAGVGRRKNVWFLNQGDLPYFPWAKRGSLPPAPQLTGAARVAGNISALFTVPPGPSATVAGHIAVSFTRIAGTVTITGSANVAGEIRATFAQPVTGSAAVRGEIRAQFFVNQGQQAGCISGSDTPAAGKPVNAVY